MHSEPESVTVYKMLNTLPGLRQEMHVGVRFRLEHLKTSDSGIITSAYCAQDSGTWLNTFYVKVSIDVVFERSLFTAKQSNNLDLFNFLRKENTIPMSTLLYLHRVLAETYVIMIVIWNSKMFMNMIFLISAYTYL